MRMAGLPFFFRAWIRTNCTRDARAMTRGDGKRKWTFPRTWDNQTCSGSVDKGMEKPRAEEWRQLVVICLGAFLFFNSFGSINVALPTIQIYFGASLTAVQ